ncbi:hypothetical protein [Coprococcus comes]|uniref:hypothetical protein n=1 Tax=Coprococcus comes TaxID=410072 RepID=UPI00189B249C|nr:hypothetical protein [Coprococcus comes]
MLYNQELEKWKNELCNKLELSAEEVVLTVTLDSFICPMGEHGCRVTYEIGNPGKYHIWVSRNKIKEGETVLNSIRNQIRCYE